MKRIALAGAAAAVLLTAGCATIMHGTSQDIGFSSTPTNASIIVDNKPLGNTPTIAKLSRKDNHIVRMELDGYQPFEATLTRGVSGWVWGNIIFGGLIGLAVDGITGGLYKLTPEQIAGQMAEQRAGATVTQDGIYVLVVLQSEPGWQQIGQLERE
jgi:hypothetical protein